MSDLVIERNGCVFLLDDDSQRGQIVRHVTQELGFEFELVRDASQLTLCDASLGPGCVVISDAAITQCEQAMGRLVTDFQSFLSGGRLNPVGRCVATVVICQEPEVQKIVRYMRAGALTVLPTPLDAESLSHWLIEAIESDRSRRADEARLDHMRRVYQRLAERKRIVLQHMIDGRASKWSAHELDVSRRTIELDRAEILNAFEVTSAIELARLLIENKCLPLNYKNTGSPAVFLTGLAETCLTKTSR